MRCTHWLLGAPLLLAACSDEAAPAPAPAGPRARTNIQHVVVVWQENHTFDNYFGRYCTAAPGSNPACTEGPACCEAAPAREASGAAPIALDDASNARRDPDHSRACESQQVNGGAMDRFVAGAAVPGCSDPGNFAVAAPEAVAAYHAFAREGALADRYFQPEVGSTSANDMHLAVARHVFDDNTVAPEADHAECNSLSPRMRLTGRTVADVVLDAGFTFATYIEGYAAARASLPDCAQAPDECPAHRNIYPCTYDPSDIPFAYYGRFADNPTYMRDHGQLARDVAAGALPHVSYVKAIGYRTEHPGYGTTIGDGMRFVSSLVSLIRGSRYANDTLILLTWDEGGGYYDHVAPPGRSAVDMQEYGTRVPLVAIGRFARRNRVSHVTMEHASIVKFIEFNYTGATGQLGARDASAANLGSLLDPAATGTAVPER
ncbi:MAG: alkaline phosphatase family protein [Polyangiales bacterium]